MKLIKKNNFYYLCLLEHEFLIISDAIIELSENYHKPKPPPQRFEDKFGYSLEKNDRLYKEFLEIRKNLTDGSSVCFDETKYDVFLVALNEIINNYEEYEFQTITGFHQQEVQEVLNDLQKVLIEK